MYNMTYTHNHKVAIPKLDRGPPPTPRAPGKHWEGRATIACKACRERKAKCSGDVPQCASCQANGLDCVYEQARRDRLKEATDLNHTFVSLFKEFNAQLSEADRKRVQDVIDEAEDDAISSVPVPSVRPLGERVRRSSVSGIPDQNSPVKKPGEAHVTASVGSNEDLDFLDEDLLRTRESRETGYVGQNSEVQWLRSVQRQAENNETDPYGLPYGPPGTSETASNERSEALHQRRQEAGTLIRHVTDATFYLDSDSIELDFIVYPYDLPNPDVAERLLDCYMSTIHSSFPIVPPSFEDQIRRFIGSLKQNKAYHVPDRWRALMNLIFAIGTKYSHLIGTEWQGDERDHLVYMNRASHLLGMNNTVMFISGPDHSLVQATALFSFYFLVVGHVSRAWLMIGISIRLAQALGLHLRNEDPSADKTKKEMLLRTWWSLHLIECLISSITGRPPIIASEHCTVPLPRVSPEEQHHTSKVFRRPSRFSNHGSSESSQAGSSSVAGQYLVDNINISLLTQRVLTGLYAPRTAVRAWQDIQGKIKDLLSDVEDWAKDALSGNLVPNSQPQAQLEREREQLLFKMHYYSTKILITRPCLCRIERRIKNESDLSTNFNSEMATTCVNAARELTALFPDEPGATFVYEKAPWWNIVHFIMQCAAVLLLEIAYQGRHTEKNNDEITVDIQKLMKWLRSMKSNDPVAGRAYHLVRRILLNCAPALQAKAAELLTEGSSSQAAGEQAFRPFVSPHKQQQSGSGWGPGEFFNGSTSSMDHQCYPSAQSSSQNHSHTANHHATYANFSTEHIHMQSTFGNPFINNWDETVPAVDMQHLWHNPDYDSNTNLFEHLDDMDLLGLYTETQEPYDLEGTTMA